MEVDLLFWNIVEEVCGPHLPREEGLITCQCCHMHKVMGHSLRIPGIQQHSFLTVQLPIKLSGLGIRSQVVLIPYAESEGKLS